MSHNGSNAYEVIYKIAGVKRTMIVNAKDPHSAGNRIKNGRVVAIRKIDPNDIFGFGDDKFQSLMTPNKKILTGEDSE